MMPHGGPTGQMSRGADTDGDSAIATPDMNSGGMAAATNRSAAREDRRSRAPVVAVVVAVGLVSYVAWRLDWSTLSSLGTAHAWFLVGIVSATHLSTLPLKAIGWRSALSVAVTDGSAVTLRLVMAPVAIGALFNLVLAGRVGEAARVLLVQERLRRAGREAQLTVVVGSAITETLVSTVAWVVLVAIAGAFLGLPTALWIALAGLAAGWLLIVLASARKGWSAPPGSVSERLPNRLLLVIRGVWSVVALGHSALRRPGIVAPLAGASIAGWLAQWLGVYVLLAAFDIEGGWRAATLVLIAVSVAQTLPVLPGNVGIFQAALALPLVTSYGVPAATALAFGVVLQLAQTLPVALWGAVALSRQGESIRRLRNSARGLRSRPGRLPT
ncbi:MAG: flippase-like domain-containing protein [Actinobacteria bacterium]|nr:flippase-like domain-containing protein [Actinomycetota bacterium]